MWKLDTIQAQNLCAFRTVDYSIQQNRTTLIFGHNMDNDSQASNGSGKSALIEAIAIGLTGEPLRNIKRDEIINDMSEEAIVTLVLKNCGNGETLSVNRILSRKNPQVISVTSIIDNQETPIIQPSVADYNKYILDIIGLTKDDLYANYILSKHKYTPFLSSSDKDKKEIINRFSNGILVDDSIAALQTDMGPIQSQLQEAEGLVALCSGKVSAIADQIATEISEADAKANNKAQRIEDLKSKIEVKQQSIGNYREERRATADRIKKLDETDNAIQELESSDKLLTDVQAAIDEIFSSNNLDELDDYVSSVNALQKQAGLLNEQHDAIAKTVSTIEPKVNDAKKRLSAVTEKYNEFNDSYGDNSKQLSDNIDKLSASIAKLETDQVAIKKQRGVTDQQIASLQKQLAGVITCPQCKHEFTISGDVDIDDVRSQADEKTTLSNKLQKDIIANDDKLVELALDSQKVRTERSMLDSSKSSISTEVNDAQVSVNNAQTQLLKVGGELSDLLGKIASINKKVENVRLDLFDQAFDIIDLAVKQCESRIQSIDIDIENAKGSLSSYEEAIKEAQSSSANDLMDSLTASKVRYENELSQAISSQESIEGIVNEYKIQEATFIEFKTHLANTKINDLSRITNEFLDRIGSDIRIAFSGYTVLKSGKIRDKISISLIRDGIDCGSFDKFSEGEKARVNLANILAMHKLTNVNCLDGKGLDLLVLDEILDATDEPGLASIFEALNSLHITSLVVSHGNIAENYPHKLVVKKQNKVSFINEES